MRIARLISALFVGVVASQSTSAQDLSLKVCPLEEAVRQIQNYYISMSAKIAEQTLPFVDGMRKLSEKGSAHPERPVSESLTAAERAQFQELRFKSLWLDAHKIAVSGYLRDARVVAKMAEVAYASSQGRSYGETDPDYFYWTVLSLLRLQHPASDVNPTFPDNPAECTVETGLHFYEQLMLREIGRATGFDEAVKRLTAAAQKYKIDMKQDGWVEKIPNEKDKKAALLDLGTVNQGPAKAVYVNDVENLKFLNRVMLLGFQSDMQDVEQSHSEAELSKMVTSFAEKLKSYDERTQILSGLENMIAQKIPSEARIEAEGRNKRLRERGIIQ